MNTTLRSLWLALFFLVTPTSTAFADTSYRCVMNAHASRDYSSFYGEPAWCGGVSNCGSKAEFEIRTFHGPKFADLSYREYLVSLPPTKDQVTIKSFWAVGDDGQPISEEYQGIVISKDGPVLFFIYRNPTGNKIHTFALDTLHKKLIASTVTNGLTSLEVQAKTFDCQ